MEKGKLSGLEQMYNYPLLRALTNRRSRRVGLGCEMTGALQHESKKTPVPLTEVETALLCFAGAGQTGLALGDMPTDKSANSLMTLRGRTFPSACNNQRTRLIFTNDDGVYLHEPRESSKTIDTLEDLQERLRHFSNDIIKLKDGRLELPLGRHALMTGNDLTVNRPGQTVFMPIVDTGAELINLALIAIQYEGWQFIDGETRQPAGIEKWIERLNLRLKAPLSTIEQNVLVTSSLEAAFIAQNILLVAEAMGLGAFPLGGYTPFIVMGGTPLTRGLGFRYVSDRKGRLNPVGIDGILEGLCPPYWEDMRSVVDAVVREKFGEGGIFSGHAKDMPLIDQQSYAEGTDRISEEVVECVKDFCTYVYDTYGRFPSSVDTMSMPLWVTAHHLDLDFYERYYKAEVINETQRRHMEEWH